MRIIIQPFAKPLTNGLRNAKNYPYWDELLRDPIFRGHEIIQIGYHGERTLVKNCKFGEKLSTIVELIQSAHAFISIDSFLPHMAHNYNKRGLVIFSKSDPLIFGYPENMNILVDRNRLRPDQFGNWEYCPFDEAAFFKPDQIAKLFATRFL